MFDELNWGFAFAILVTSLVLGKLLDAAFHRNYNEELKERLFGWAIRFDELSYVRLIHQDAKRGLRLLEQFFGKGRFSWRFAGASVIPPALISTIWIIDNIEYISAEDALLIIYVVLSVLIGQVSLLITKVLLGLARPRLISLIGVLSTDIVAAYLLGPLPFVTVLALAGQFGSDSSGYMFDLLEYLFTYLFIAAREPGIEPYLLWSMFFVAVLPTCIHMVLVIHDLANKTLIRPLAKFLSGLLEFLSDEKQPITWALGMVGALPVILKAWTEAIP